MLKDIEEAATAVGITAFITNSTEKLETQLNRLTDIDQLPIMLVSWDIVTDLVFDENGFLQNPSAQITLLLMDKAEEKTKDNMQSTSEEMAKLFQQFIQKLYQGLIKYQRNTGTNILSGIQFTLVPTHGSGKHSGVLGRFTMSGEIVPCPK